jgi:hypothetical protein
MNACIVTLTFEDLARLLKLPEGAEINAMSQPIFRPGVVQFRLHGIGPHVKSGEMLLEVPAELQRVEYTQVRWGKNE